MAALVAIWSKHRGTHTAYNKPKGDEHVMICGSITLQALARLSQTDPAPKPDHERTFVLLRNKMLDYATQNRLDSACRLRVTYQGVLADIMDS